MEEYIDGGIYTQEGHIYEKAPIWRDTHGRIHTRGGHTYKETHTQTNIYTKRHIVI